MLIFRTDQTSLPSSRAGRPLVLSAHLELFLHRTRVTVRQYGLLRVLKKKVQAVLESVLNIACLSDDRTNII